MSATAPSGYRPARRAQVLRMSLIGSAVVGAIYFSTSVFETALGSGSFLTGWCLLALCLVLALFSARKKLGLLPLGRASTWLRLHQALGLVALLVFARHVGFRWPDGGLDQMLAALFLLTAGSGVVGSVFSRVLPPRLTTRGQTVLFERIPRYVRMLAEEVEALVKRSMHQTRRSAIADFYTERLLWFFARPRNLLAHAIGSNRPCRLLLQDVDAVRRYADPREVALLDEIGNRIRLKNELDHQYCCQLLLKGWLFVHIPATYGLGVVLVVHLVVVHAFRSAAG